MEGKSAKEVSHFITCLLVLSFEFQVAFWSEQVIGYFNFLTM